MKMPEKVQVAFTARRVSEEVQTAPPREGQTPVPHVVVVYEVPLFADQKMTAELHIPLHIVDEMPEEKRAKLVEQAIGRDLADLASEGLEVRRAAARGG